MPPRLILAYSIVFLLICAIAAILVAWRRRSKRRDDLLRYGANNEIRSD